MISNFEEAINQLIFQGYGILDNWLPEGLLSDLENSLVSRLEADYFHKAQIGNGSDQQRIGSVRGDEIFWLNENLAVPAEKEFLSIIGQFTDYLNVTCFAGIKSFEFHYAVYQSGTRYARHKDQFRSDDSRKYSMVFYLNRNWKAGDGGELMIYTQEDVKIEPVFGRLVFFKSELEHEVLLSNFERKSITGWLKDLAPVEVIG
ncbi:MAG: 2OG-Fe(II) oxygenase [Crocinitomicaceae bacterium]|nr:2OG-Fe(II) oxygenase [Crocinitomicaceae bacterium]